MRRFPRHLLVAAAAAALGTGACTSTISDPPPPALDLVEERLAQLSQRAEAFASLIVDADLAAAFVVDDGTATRWHLTPTVSEVDDSGLPRPAVPFAELTPAEIAAEARALADECPDSYAAEVTALTPSALLGEVRCVEDRTLARLHGEPLPTFSQQWSAADWQRLLDLTIEVNGSPMVERISVREGEVLLMLGNTAMTNGCRPSIVLESDGEGLTWSCLRRLDPPPGTLEGWTGQDVALAIDEVAAGGRVSPGAGRQISLTPSGVDLEITVSNGADSAHGVASR